MANYDDEFEVFARASAERLRATAFMLCRDWHLAQDLTQTTLTKLYVVWRKAAQADNPVAYAQKMLFRAYLDHRRRRSSSERAVPEFEDVAHAGSPDLRLTMLDALAQLPPRDRAIVILRYFEDYSVEQTAEVLNVPASVVKTQTKRSLSKLKELLAPEQVALFA
ncbi:SigE family RNA polymerase sigma factor [Winogradskya consettensis]|uniref:RNA polymerase sigma24 factor n=2 Tax=Winogradskya TaxID=3240235 RepID=A0A919VV28_9ACTN|nr:MULTISPECIES: SigE family RNA polymerase sigma factor [Actinoplanes]GIE26204.1 RNA polymerase sigma24 factor [Actinoplanes humidus]GIM80109.1 RNA polymerase sigma24 factor [Actinoplanes consettensis]